MNKIEKYKQLDGTIEDHNRLEVDKTVQAFADDRAREFFKMHNEETVMNKAKERQMLKSDYEVTFRDSSEYFLVENAKMIQEAGLVRFLCFDGDNFKEDIWYPILNIYRIKRYARDKKKEVLNG